MGFGPKYVFYSIESEEVTSKKAAAQESYQLLAWRPSWKSVAPRGFLKPSFIVWWFFHQFHVFGNGDYSIFAVYDGDVPIHHSVIFPKHFRFPFMRQNDLQVGDIWTHPDYRGKGIATFVLRRILAWGDKRRRFWYIVEAGNTASIRVAEKAGLKKYGEGSRTKAFGLKLLGAFRLGQSPEDALL